MWTLKLEKANQGQTHETRGKPCIHGTKQYGFCCRAINELPIYFMIGFVYRKGPIINITAATSFKPLSMMYYQCITPFISVTGRRINIPATHRENERVSNPHSSRVVVTPKSHKTHNTVVFVSCVFVLIGLSIDFHRLIIWSLNPTPVIK